jgi:hypothetical protein
LFVHDLATLLSEFRTSGQLEDDRPEVTAMS